MSNNSQILSDYETIIHTSFWPLFISRIERHRKVLSRLCETEDDPRREQGGVSALDFVLGKNERDSLAEIIIKELKNKE